MSIVNTFMHLVTWWNGQTLGTRIFTARNGEKVGEDEQGNVYYQSKDGKRRWVIYNGEVEASRISPDWHGWLHHTFDARPGDKPLTRKDWEKPHQENLTGGSGMAVFLGLPGKMGPHGARTTRTTTPSHGNLTVPP